MERVYDQIVGDKPSRDAGPFEEDARKLLLQVVQNLEAYLKVRGNGDIERWEGNVLWGLHDAAESFHDATEALTAETDSDNSNEK